MTSYAQKGIINFILSALRSKAGVQMTDVVAALIWNGDHFLACQRPANKSRALLWEFVGGKVEPGETWEAALIRECKEELDVTVVPTNVFMTVIHEYPDITVKLILFNAYIAKGIPQKLEHNDIRWITTDMIDSMEFCPADADILKVLKTLDNELQATLYGYRDETYKAFQAKLIPTVAASSIIGVRIPTLRKMKASINQLGKLPHRYFEENILHALAINRINNVPQCITALNEFLPFVDNWSVCDTISPSCFKRPNQAVLSAVSKWMHSEHPYTIRFGILVLMKYYLDEAFDPAFLSMVGSIRSDHYYVNMMIAWYFATALAKQYVPTLSYLKTDPLDKWTHNKTIQKAVESDRLTSEQKQQLRKLKK